MKFQVLTLFPESFESLLKFSLIGKAVANKQIECTLINPRDFASDKHRTVDETPYGGGEGMVMKADVLKRAWDHAVSMSGPSARVDAGSATVGAVKPHTIFLTPQGKPLTQEKLWELSRMKSLILVCGHYEGVDERFVETCVDEEISIGDFVLTGGEWPAQVLIDGIGRLIPGVVGNSDSTAKDSFEGGLLKHPQFTRPREFEGIEIPEVLASGDHKKIEAWRRGQSEARTQARRPDLWEKWVAENPPLAPKPKKKKRK